jgi:glycosyltransferase involved in cell wall biosynthesis
VLLPVRDCAAWLPTCLRSLARQTLTSFECVIVDDGSRDGSLSLACDYAADDPRFRVFATAPRGLVPALNEGLRHCRAPVVARMDADDWMHRERLAAQLAALDADASVAAVGCHVRLFPRSELAEGMRAYERWLAGVSSPDDVRREAFVECPVAHPTLAIRTPLLRDLGYRDRGWPEDYDLLHRLLARGERVAVVPRRLLGWRQREGRLSRTHPAYSIERFTACKASFLAEGFLAKSERYVLWGYGATGRALHRALRAHGRTPSAIVELHPGRVGNRIHGAPVLPPAALAGRDPEPVVVSVAGATPRALIRAQLAQMGYRETEDFFCAA